MRHYGAQGQANEDTVHVFVESFAPPPRMVIFGAVDFTAALARVAKVLGYHVTVCDAREIFATKRRFPMADEVVVDWPNRVLDRLGPTLGPRDAVCVLTHDPKFDVPAIEGALASRVGYVGVMGSRKTHSKRMERLAEVGVTDPVAAGPHHGPHRHRHRRPLTRGDRHLDPGRDHRPADGSQGALAARRRRPHPLRTASLADARLAWRSLGAGDATVAARGQPTGLPARRALLQAFTSTVLPVWGAWTMAVPRPSDIIT